MQESNNQNKLILITKHIVMYFNLTFIQPLSIKQKWYLAIAVFVFLFVSPALSQETEKPNIIFIISDDLNDHIEGYAANLNTFTPNLKLLQENGTVFLNAYASAPVCAPSRTSFLTGKDLAYTNVYKNGDGDYKCSDFGDNFTVENGNEIYYSIPQYFKDTLGYYTFNLNKVFHCHKNFIEFDTTVTELCLKSGAWNKYIYYNDSAVIKPAGLAVNQGVNGYAWAAIPDSLEPYLADFVVTDSAISFIDQYGISPETACNKPFLMMVGYQKPHKDQFIPEKYFLSDYLYDFNAEPFDIPYNYPPNSYPLNGIKLPPQPDTPFADLDALLINTISPLMVKNVDTHFTKWVDDLATIPEINPEYSESQRIEILEWSKRANGVMAYLAAIQFMDAQFGRLYATLQAKPEILNNTIIVFIGDNGYGLSEKRHWGKYALWDTDVRVPLIIADLRNPKAQICNRTVSLLDLFPTLLDLTNSAYPNFPDNSNYFDGNTLIPLLQNPDTVWNRPVISATKKDDSGGEANCFPQYSVRDERFHLITYRKNGTLDGSCDSTSSLLEYELYEIGKAREVDPYEWNNLGYNPDYLPVINYLSQWHPTGPLYLQKTYTLNIIDDITECYIDYGFETNLSFDLYDQTGANVEPPINYVYRWTNNLNNDTLYGSSIEFSSLTIDETVFSASSDLLIYVEMVDTSNTFIAALDMIHLKINSINIPVVSFDVVKYATNSVTIENFTITGDYNSFYWDFGFGPILYNEVPGPIQLDDISTVPVTCYVNYGNHESCITPFEKIFVDNINEYFSQSEIILFPNPATNVINVVQNSMSAGAKCYIYNTLGNLVYQTTTTAADYPFMQISTQFLPSGVYFLVLKQEDFQETGIFVVAQHN